MKLTKKAIEMSIITLTTTAESHYHYFLRERMDSPRNAYYVAMVANWFVVIFVQLSITSHAYALILASLMIILAAMNAVA